MADERTERAKAIFNAVRRLDDSEREALLDAACRDDADLRREVESLLKIRDAEGAHHVEESTAWLRSAQAAPLAEKAGTRIGPYKLLQEIGVGGFGTVFMAEQDQPVRRRVALKVIKLGMDTKQVVARFEQERQALALMDHPNIAKVFDAGVTESGRPYFVMEYVRGDPITEFADAHKLSLRVRLELFAQVCAAVQHAHTKGIIHRDLKPRNVLVSMSDGKPFAKVIDFGIAKATGARLTDKTLFTEHRQLIGTPEYMSPEQAEGSPDIDTRTDVYSLGVLLYELLTGVTPFDGTRLRSAAFGEMQRIIKEEDPPAPSLRLTRNLATLAATAAARQSEPSKLGTQIKGELDWIAMKALDKDRARRYETAKSLAEDINRHLTGEPVVAAPPSAAYRVRKFARKHRGQVIAGSAIAAALVLGLAATTWQWLEARRSSRALHRQIGFTCETMQKAFAEYDAAWNSVEHPPDALVDLRKYPVRIYQLSDGSTIAFRPKGREGPSQEYEFLTVPSPLSSTTIVMDAVFNEDTHWRSFQLANSPALSSSQLDDSLRLVEALGNALREEGIFQSSMYGELLVQRDVAEVSAYTANIASAQMAMDALNFPEARERLDKCPESKRSWEWKFLNLKAQSILWGAQNVHDSVFNPDGTRVLIASGDTAQIHDAQSGAPLGPPMRHEGNIAFVAFSSDGTQLVTSSGTVRRRFLDAFDDNCVVVWDVATGRRIGEPIRHPGTVLSTAFSPDGRFIITACDDGTTTNFSGSTIVRIWNASSTRQVAPPLPGGWLPPILSPDGISLLSVPGDAVHIYDVPDGRARRTLRHDNTVSSAAFSPDGSYVVTSSLDQTARSWDAHTGREIWKAVHVDELESVIPSPDGKTVLTLAGVEAKLFHLDSGDPVGAPMRYASRAYYAAYSPDSQQVLIAYYDGTVRLWSALSGSPVDGFMRQEGTILSTHFSSNGTQFATVSDSSARVWNAQGRLVSVSATMRSETEPWLDELGAGSFSMDGSLAMIRKSGRMVIIPVALLDSPEVYLRGHQVDIEAELSLLVSDECSTPARRQEDVAFNSFSNAVNASAQSPDGKRQVFAMQDHSVRIVDTSAHREMAVMRLEQPATNLHFTADGSRLILMLADGNAMIWDTRDPDARRAELEARWAEREPARVYVENLVVGATSPSELDSHIRADTSIAPLRRLVALEVFGDTLAIAESILKSLFDEPLFPEEVVARVLEDESQPNQVRQMAAALVPDRWGKRGRPVVAAGQLVTASDCSADQARRAIELVERYDSTWRNDDLGYTYLSATVRAAAYLKLGEYELALDALAEFEPSRDVMYFAGDRLDTWLSPLLYRAMAYTQLGERAKATEAIKSIREIVARFENDDPDWLESKGQFNRAKQALAEAEAILDAAEGAHRRSRLKDVEHP